MNSRYFLLILGAVFVVGCAPAEHVARKGVHVVGHGAAKTGHVVSRVGDRIQSHGEN
ncbi:MAG: hypothetical protein JWL90_1834 [Chthoniobacteraceae bacterium]|nr:hypothetical protein [Chthoniobacteraceae bacterium]MDB6173817.1 hypothetical protein [Chthoniobacteraceae bacterium]